VVLGIETSCDETAASVVVDGRKVLSSVVSSQVDLHARFGGVVPEIASRAHVELLTPVIAEAMLSAGVEADDLDAVAATVGPGLVGALLVGVSTAKSLALVWDVPFVAVNHLEAHLHAAYLEEPDLKLPAVVLLVSGGHTMLVHWRTTVATACSARRSTTPRARRSTRWPATWGSGTRAARPSTRWRCRAIPRRSPSPGR
jgi:N6-L-threonylcarbamoyladenine synthase